MASNKLRARWLVRTKIVALFGALILTVCAPVFAHDPGLSSANMEIAANTIELQLTFNQRDVAAAISVSVQDFHSTAGQEKLGSTARHAAVLVEDGKARGPSTTTASIDENNNVEFRYSFPKSPFSSELAFESALLPQLSFGHRQAFSARDSSGKEVSRRILSARENIVSIPLQAAHESAADGSRFLEFLALGIRHILTGYDHLLFLFGLLIVCRTPKSALLLITCFTLAHSLTLALSTFDLVNLPSRFVEATIAASILYVGLENLLRRDALLRGRWLLTFVFGLVHGLGFASVLREMGVASRGLGAILPLVAFNSGVELGQLAVAAISLPLIWYFRRRPAFLRIGVPACSALVAAAGAYWLLERSVLS